MVLGMQLCYHYNSSGNTHSKPGETILYSLVQDYQTVLKIKKCRKGWIVQLRHEHVFFFFACMWGRVLCQYTGPLPPLQYICKDLPKLSLHENVVFSVCARKGNAILHYIMYHVEFHFWF